VRRLQRWASERVGRGKLLLRCRLLSHERRFGANGEEESGGIVFGANRLWGETPMGRNVYGTNCPSMGRNVRGAKSP